MSSGGKGAPEEVAWDPERPFSVRNSIMLRSVPRYCAPRPPLGSPTGVSRTLGLALSRALAVKNPHGHGISRGFRF